MRITVVNRGPEAAPLHVLPTSGSATPGRGAATRRKPALAGAAADGDWSRIAAEHAIGTARAGCSATARRELLFTENETNTGGSSASTTARRYVKDGINDYVVHGARDAVNPEQIGTKAAAHYALEHRPRGDIALRCGCALHRASGPPAARRRDFDAIVRRAATAEADEFYATVHPADADRRRAAA